MGDSKSVASPKSTLRKGDPHHKIKNKKFNPIAAPYSIFRQS